MTKSECIQSLKEQGYTLKALDENETKILRNWKDDPASDDVIDHNYGVILNQDNQFVIDIDDSEFNEILQEYLDKTLVNQTGAPRVPITTGTTSTFFNFHNRFISLFRS